MTQENPTNLFHPEAVATYGRITKTCENLGYMFKPLKELNQYLINYPKSEERYGCAIGLQGEYGSGKTHLLTWLSQKARDKEHIKPIVIYAKADRASFFDLYTQLLSQLSREKLQQILGEALQQLAKEQVGKLKVTQSIGDRIKGSEDLLVLNKEKNIDIEQLLIQLRNKLKDPDKPNETLPGVIPKMLTLIDDSSLGDLAYQWLLGNEVLDPKALGLNHHLRKLQQEQQGSVEPDITAVNALETIAALFRIAQRPLIILIDQLEQLVSADGERLKTLFSVMKKMIEQLNRQKVLTFIAGVDGKSWDKFPRDVTPRLRYRELLEIGNLSFKETKSLLESYTEDLPSQFNSDAIETIYTLSGGNPREIIRIAYYAYEDKEVKGKLSKVNENILIRSAKESRTIADRNQLALQMVDPILKEFGNKVVTRQDVGNGEESVLLDRLLMTDDDRPRLALMTLKATDRLSEINSAKQFKIVREYLENKYPSIPLIVVAVGYSSDEVRNLISQTDTVLQFDPQSFVGQLKRKITELLAQQSRFVNKSSNFDIGNVLEDISKRLEYLELKRNEEIDKIFERFTQKLGLGAEKIKEEIELRSRVELQEALEELQKALREENRSREREIIKSILVANESYLKIKQFDYLGSLYLKLLTEASNPKAEKKVADLNEYRSAIIRELKRLLEDKNIFDHLVEQPLLFSIGISFIFIVLENILIIKSNYDQLITMSATELYLWYTTIPLAVFLITIIAIVGYINYLIWLKKYRWKNIEQQVKSS